MGKAPETIEVLISGSNVVQIMLKQVLMVLFQTFRCRSTVQYPAHAAQLFSAVNKIRVLLGRVASHLT